MDRVCQQPNLLFVVANIVNDGLPVSISNAVCAGRVCRGYSIHHQYLTDSKTEFRKQTIQR
jgi:hypothetical protein